jgi:hypothetical protein
MTHFSEARKLRYEIYVMETGRWRLAHTVDDERETLGRPYTPADHQRTEGNVLSQGRSLLASGRFEAVKVVRERLGPDGLAVVSEIFHKTNAARTGARSAGVRRLDADFPACETVADLARRPAAHLLAIVLRDFLLQLRITALELLHYPSHLAKLQAAHALFQAAINEIARNEANGAATMAERVRHLERLFDQAAQEGRAAMAERGLPTLADGNMAAAVSALAARCAGDALRGRAFFVLARRLQPMPTYLEKLAFACDNAERGDDAASAPLDEYIAGCLDIPNVLMEVLGPRENLAAALAALAELAAGRLVADTGNPALGRLNRLIAAGRLPLTAEAVWQRIVQDIDGHAPLSRKDPGREWGLTVALSEQLAAVAPAAMRAAVESGMQTRILRLRDRD